MSKPGIQASSSGTKALAFFDVDETLVAEKTMFTVLRALAVWGPEIDADELLGKLHRMRGEGAGRAEVNRAFYRGLSGLDRRHVMGIVRTYLQGRMNEDRQQPFSIRNSLARMEGLRRRGVMPVFVSGSACDFLGPIADQLDVRHVLATQLQVDRTGRYTGEITGRCMIGGGKVGAVSEFLVTQLADAAACHGFGDHPSDAGLISLLGAGAVIAGNPEAEQIALQEGWEIIPRNMPVTEVA